MTAQPHAVVERLGEDFLAEAFGRTFRVIPGDAQCIAGLLDWDDLNEIIARHRLEPPRLRLSADGVVVPLDAYTVREVARRRTVWHRIHPASLHEQLAQGATMVIDAFDELHPRVHGLAHALEARLRSKVQVNLYASWKPREGFGVHWDDHDVVVVPVDGRKRWKIYGPTRVAPMYRDVTETAPPPDEPVAEFVLTPGDMHLKPRIGHVRLDRLNVGHLVEMYDGIADANEVIQAETSNAASRSPGASPASPAAPSPPSGHGSLSNGRSSPR